jgi:glycosyltransferase involved in cell wall biosynthesis
MADYIKPPHNTLIFASMVRWDTIFQRPQQLALELSKFYKIIYIDPAAYSLLGAIRNRIFGDRSRNFFSRINEITPSLTVYTPPALFPFSEQYWWINLINHQILFWLYKKYWPELSSRKPVLYLNSPFQLPLVDLFPHSMVCYDCMDDYEHFFDPASRKRKNVREKEQELFVKTNLVFGTSLRIVNLKKKYFKDPILIRNGVSSHFLSFAKCQSKCDDIKDFPKEGTAVIGYIGVISKWFDAEAICLSAARHPDWQFILIGPVQFFEKEFRVYKNIFLLGAKPFEQLPAYVNLFDIAVIPFKINELTLSVNPVKVYEYFALGKKVVATRLPELVQFDEICTLAESTEDFIDKLEIAVRELATEEPEKQKKIITKRIQIAQENSWAIRAKEIHQVLQSTHQGEI